MISKNFNSILDIINAFPDEQSCIEHLEAIRWNGNVVSPFDPESKVYKCKDNRYKCKNSNKYFNVKTDTIFHNTQIDLQKWFIAIWLITSHKKGISSLQLSRDLNITQTTAWFMLHRVRNCFGIEKEVVLDNEVEIDETYIGGKNKNRHQHKKIPNSQGRSSKDKTPVVGMVERDGMLKANKVKNVNTNTLMSQAVNNINQSASIYTDEWKGYSKLKFIFDHSVVKHNKNEYVKGRIHTNTIEGFWSLLKRGIYGIYHFTSEKHLQMYVDEFVFRYNTRGQSEQSRFNILLQRTQDKRITYNQLISNEF